jgi:NAD(P)-dependent dehydrogenase (short-subunit alcohol dehydrogenase family)
MTTEGVLSGRSVIITGAARGLGRAYAIDAAREGAAVVVNDLNLAECTHVVDEIVAANGVAVACASSVSDWKGAESILRCCLDSFGAVDGLVNNAGVISIGDPWDVTESVARRLVEVNLLGAIFMGTAAMRAMRDGAGGSIVNVTSSAQLGMARMGVYSATKGALASLTYSWAIDLAPHNIRVNAYSPVAGTAMSDLAGVPREIVPTPADNAAAVTYLLSDLSEGISGQVVQRRQPAELVVAAHPSFTSYGATIGSSAASVAEAFGPVLREHAQIPGWAVGRS